MSIYVQLVVVLLVHPIKFAINDSVNIVILSL